jgi:anti-sigma B factor antagonist
MATDSPLSIELVEGKSPGTRILRLKGPLTLKNIFPFQSELRSGGPHPITILDLTGVPYMDSAGMGALMNYFVHCQRENLKFIVAGVSPRVLELFKLTKVDNLIAIAPTVEEAEAEV